MNQAKAFSGGDFLIAFLSLAAGVVLPHLPKYINRLINYPAEIMAHDYSFNAKLDKVEIYFGMSHSKNQQEISDNKQLRNSINPCSF